MEDNLRRNIEQGTERPRYLITRNEGNFQVMIKTVQNYGVNADEHLRGN